MSIRRFLIVTGKGGVGKTTVAAAMAVLSARQGKRVLLCMCNAKERMSVLFGTPTIGPEVVSVAKDIWAVNIHRDRAIEEYGVMTLRSRTLYRLLFDKKYVRSFFRAVPGIQEWAMLGKAWWHTTEMRPDGMPKYDTVILDAPATGHGLDMLRVPKVIADVVPTGPLRRDAERAYAQFRDPEQSGVILVTLAEEMPVTETLELRAALVNELDLPVAEVIVNETLRSLFSEDEHARLQTLAPDGLKKFPPLAAARDRSMRERLQAASIQRLADEIGKKPRMLPLLFEGVDGPEALGVLADALAH